MPTSYEVKADKYRGTEVLSLKGNNPLIVRGQPHPYTKQIAEAKQAKRERKANKKKSNTTNYQIVTIPSKPNISANAIIPYKEKQSRKISVIRPPLEKKVYFTIPKKSKVKKNLIVPYKEKSSRNLAIVPRNKNLAIVPRNRNLAIVPKNENLAIVPKNENLAIVPKNENLAIVPKNSNLAMVARNRNLEVVPVGNSELDITKLNNQPISIKIKNKSKRKTTKAK